MKTGRDCKSAFKAEQTVRVRERGVDWKLVMQAKDPKASLRSFASSLVVLLVVFLCGLTALGNAQGSRAIACTFDEGKVVSIAGSPDDFAPGSDAPSASPSAALLVRVNSNVLSEVGVDHGSINSEFVHTFQWKNCHHVSRALLEIKVRALSSATSGQPNTDTLNLWFTGSNSTEMSYQLWDTNTQAGDTVTILLDLGALPAQGSNLTSGSASGTESLLDEMNATEYLDLRIQDDTSVDYAKLSLCCEEPGCACGDWQGVTVNNEWFAECGDVIELTPDDAQGKVSIVPHYQCVGADCPEAALTLFWEIHGPNGLYLSSGGQRAPPIQFTPTEAGRYIVKMEPSCDRKGCCEPCEFEIIIKEQECACGTWDTDEIKVNGQDVSCGETVTLASPGAVTIDPPFHCSGSACDPVEYKWVVGPFAGGPTVAPIEFTLNTSGSYGATITPYCNGTKCPSCQFKIKIEPERCNCGKWSDQDTNNLPDIVVEGSVVNIGDTISVPQSTLPDVEIKADYQCQGSCNPVAYSWKLIGPGGFTAQSSAPSASPILLSQPQALNGPGSYDVVLVPNCSNKECEEFELTFVIEEEPCNCGGWAKEKITIDSPAGWEESVYECSQDIHLSAKVCASEFLEITPHYVCDPPAPPCKVSYIIDVPQWGVHEEFTSTCTLTIDKVTECPKQTRVRMTAFCGDTVCDQCEFTLCCEPQGCDCGDWAGVTIEDCKHVECGDTVELAESDIQGLVTIDPHYDCVGAGCVPGSLTFYWEVNGPNQFHESSGGQLHPPIEFTPQAEGTYLVTMMPSCNSKGCCDPCRIAVEIEGPACNCEDDEMETEVMAGEDDNFSLLSTADPSAHAHPSQALLDYLDTVSSPFDCVDFDSEQDDSAFCHTFEWDECGEITKACLEVKLKVIGSVPGTDHLHLWFTDDSAYPGMNYSLWTNNNQAGDTVTLLLDLGALPPPGTNLMTEPTSGNYSLLDELNATGYLDLHIQDDTSVDYAKLTLCCAEIPCECGEWQDEDEDGVPDIMVESSTVDFVNLGDTLIIPPTGLPYLTIEPYYQCKGDCNPTYEWKLTGPGGFSAQSNVATAGPIVLSELSQPPTLDGVGQYQMTIVPYCDGHECDPFKFTFIRKCRCVEIGPPNPTPEWDKMVAWWPFEECNYDRRDGHGEAWAMNGSHPEVVNGVKGNAINVGSTGSGAYSYSVNHAWVSSHPNLNFGTGDFSIDCWIKPTDNMGTFVDKREDPNPQIPNDEKGYALRVNPTSGNLDVYLNGWHDSTLSVTLGSWHFIGVIVDRDSTGAGNAHVRVDDSWSNFSFGSGVGSLDSTAPLLFGKDQFDASDSFGGLIDEAEIYDDAMDPAFFEKIYEAGSCGKCTPHWGPHEWKIHQPQWPASGGWDVECGSVDGKEIWLADDWKCRETGNVSHIVLYGSWEDIDGEVEDYPGDVGTISRFTIMIAEDVGGGTCGEPGDILWRREFGSNEFQVVPLGGCCWLNWYGHDYTCPADARNDDHMVFYKYTFAKIPEPFVQEKGKKYWLIVKPDVEEDERHWGWSSTEYRFFCDALWGEVEETLSGSWVFNPEGDLHWPSDCTKSLNLAFRISDGPEYEYGCVGWIDADNNGVPDVTINSQIVDPSNPAVVTLPVTIYPFYECKTSSARFYWEIDGPYPFNFQSLTGPGNSVIILSPSNGTLDGPGTYTITIYPFCNGEKCKPFSFDFIVEEEPPTCECSHWSDEIIHIVSPSGWETSVYECPQDIQLPAEVCASEFLEITPHYACDPPGPECSASYIIDVPQWGLHELFDDTFPLPLDAFTLDTCDEYTEVVITAFCGDMACDRCVLKLCCESGCECSNWSDEIIHLASPIGWETSIYDCPQTIELSAE
ncbi:MAG: LamG domain-containing protein, partial [Candidatus Thorarchaeota archaeon]